MRAKLFCRTGPMAGAKFIIDHQATIGKSRKNTTVLKVGIISNHHARIYFDREVNSFFIEDLGSRNGTKLDGSPIAQKEKLSALHVITFARKLDFFFSLVDDLESNEPSDSDQGDHDFARSRATAADAISAPKMNVRAKELATVIDDRPAGALFKFRVDARRDIKTVTDSPKTRINGIPASQALIETVLEKPANQDESPSTGFNAQLEVKKLQLKFRLNEGANVIGRLSSCEICIDDPSISRRHAVINIEHRRMVLVDLGSRNHTFVNNNPVSGETEIGLNATIRFGAVHASLTLRNGLKAE